MLINNIKGKEYEIQSRNHIINILNKKAYLWENTPETILINSGIIGSHNINRLIRKEKKENPLMDTGIDVIQVNDDDTVSLVQCKNGYKNGITMHDLSGFMCWMTVLDKLNGYVYYTDKISNNLKYLPENKRLGFIKYKYEEKKDEIINENIIIPYHYQIEAKNKITEYLKNNNRCILNLPCGTGKTYISYTISKQYKQIIILSPLKQFAKQNLDCFIKYGFKGNTLLVDSDGERDIGEIKTFIENNETFIISSTFYSIDVLYNVLKYTKDLLIIVDEFHNLSKNNVSNEEDYFYKLLNEEHKILFVSATPRVYEMENEDDDNYIDMFGEIVYKMDFSKAIENKYICDYKIWLPSIHEDNSDLNKELTIYEINDVIKSKCNFLYSCLLNNGSKKIIIYCVDTTEIKQMTDAINMLNDFYFLKYDIQQITSEDTERKRTKILKNFSENEKIQLLFSVRILDECIDIPKCDSIYITYPSQSKIRTIQRICRCLRIDKNNKFKIGNIYIWCNEYDTILETLSGIKEYDIFFKDKIKINEVNFKGGSKRVEIEIDKNVIEKFVLGIKEFKFVSWDEKLEMVKKYIDENNKKPNNHDKNNNIKKMGEWVSNQRTIYKNKKNIMSNKEIYNKWTEFINDDKYNKYFYFETNEDIWINTFNNVKKYIDENNKKPNNNNKDLRIKKMGDRVSMQTQNYKKKI
jgi:superfamily II DNA or RNA helicase